MSVHLTKPAVHLPPHRISREQLLADMVTRHPDHPRMRSVQRIVGELMPRQRRFSQPLDVVLADRQTDERNNTAFVDVCTMGTEAAAAAIKEAGLSPDQIDCVITSHSTGDAVPGLDVHLVRNLGLRPDVSRRPMTQLGCGGGAHALVYATDYVRAHPGSRVLVVVAESLSSIYHHSDTGIEMMIYKALWGDSGAALVVTDRPAAGPGIEILGTWEYLLPATSARYRKRVDGEGVHFDSDKDATSSIADMAPALRTWLDRPLPGEPAGTPRPLDFIVSHTGGPAILDALATELTAYGIDKAALHHSWDSMDEVGNLGGASILDVLARTHNTPPTDGAYGLLIGFGPGFSVSAAKVKWNAR